MRNERRGLARAGLVFRLKTLLYEAKRKILPARKSGKKLRTLSLGMTRFAYMALALPILHFLIFYLYVNLNSFTLAFKDVNNNWSLENFRYVLMNLTTADGSMWIALRNTLFFFATTLILMPFNVVISYTLYKKILGYKLFQLIFFLPTIIGGVVWMSAYKNVISPDGPLVKVLLNLRLVTEHPEFLADSRSAIWACLSATVWLGLPASMLIYGGSLARIPSDIIEAGQIDGAHFWTEMRHIIVPLIWPTISTNLIFAIIGFLGSNGNILLLTQGRHQTSTLSYWMYDQIVLNSRFNIPAAMGLLMTAVTLPLTIIGRTLANKIESVEF